MATLPADRTKLALAQSNQNPLNTLGSSQNKNALTEAYDTIDLLNQKVDTNYGTGAIGTNQLATDSVTLAKMADNSVGTAELVAVSVTLAKMAASSVGTSQIVDGSVTGPKIAPATITADKFVAGALNNDTQNGLNIVALQADVVQRAYNVKSTPYNAKGDGTTDDTIAIQAAIDAAFDSGNGGIVFIPKGNYIVSSTLTLRSNVRITGAGASSILKSNFSVTGTYMLQSSSQLTRSVIDNIALQGDALQIVGGIHVDSAQRGNAIHDVWFLYVATPIYLGDSVTALYSVSNVYAVFFSSSVDTSFLDQATGIQILGNTVMLDSVEIVGNFGCGILLNGATVVGMSHLNVSGSAGYSMRKGISIINSSSQVSVDTAWIEQIDSNVTPTQLNNSIEVIGSTKISFNNMQISNGSAFIDNSTVTWKGSKFYTADTGIRPKNGATVYTDHDSYGSANFQGDITLQDGIIFVNQPNDSQVNILNNAIILAGLVEPITAVNGNATLTSDAVVFYSGDKSMIVTCAADLTGARVDMRNIVKNGGRYTLIARVKQISNLSALYMVGLSGTTTISDYPNTAQNSNGTNLSADGWYLLSYTFTVTDPTNCYGRIICTRTNTGANGVFNVDSVFLYEGNHDLSVDENVLTKSGYLKRQKTYSSVIPFSGTWEVGAIVYNSVPASAGYMGWVCTTTGTLGTLNGGSTTGGITTGTKTLTVNSATGLSVGVYITIAGVTGAKKVTAINGTTITIDSNADATVAAAAVAFSNAVLKTFGLIS